MHDTSSSSDEASSPSLSTLWVDRERSRNETALSCGAFPVGELPNSDPREPDIVPIAEVEAEVECRAHTTRTPVQCNTGVRIRSQGALRCAGTPEHTPERGSYTPESYFDALRLDTLKLTAEVDRETVERLGSEWLDQKDLAAERDETPTVTAHDGTELEFKSSNTDRLHDNRTVLMRGEGIQITAIPQGNTPVPWIGIEYGAEQCWNHSPGELVQWARDFCTLFGIKVEATKVSRMDACVDVDERFYHSDLRRFGGYFGGDFAGTMEFSDGSSGFTGFRYERSTTRPLTFRVYDKRAEQESTDGDFWPDVWSEHQVGDDAPVWRVEFEAGRDRLKERGVDTWSDLKGQKIERFWTYCTTSFAHMDRQVWDRVQDASTQDAAERAEVEPQRDAERLKLQGLGAIKAAAEVEGRDVHEVVNELQEEYL